MQAQHPVGDVDDAFVVRGDQHESSGRHRGLHRVDDHADEPDAARRHTGAALATVVVLALTARDNAEYVRSAGVLGLDPGWAPWLVPATSTAGTLCAVAVVGMLLSKGFLSGSAHNLRPTAVAALVWTAVTALRICVGAAEIFAVPVTQALDPAELTFFLTEETSGQALLMTLVLTSATAIGCRTLRGGNAAAALTVLAVVALLPPVASGHASTAGNHQVVVSALMLHAASAVVWTGGLFALVLANWKTEAVQRFSGLALWCFAITVATGVVGAATRLERWSDFTSTRYGTILSRKRPRSWLWAGSAGVFIPR
jgi:putative copper resistance protein D